MSPIVHRSCLFAFVAVVLAATAALPSAQQAPNWTGSIRCDLQGQAPGYSHQETQTWMLTGGPAVPQGSVRAYPATWTVTGQGSFDRTRNNFRRIAQWTAAVPGPNGPVNAPIGFTLTPSGQLVVAGWHAQLTAPGSYSGTDQNINDGVAQAPRRLAATLYEWQFPRIEVPGTQTQVTGSRSYEVRAQLGPLQPDDAVATVSCTWSFGQGSAAPPPQGSGAGGGSSGGAVSGGAAGGGAAGGAAPGGATFGGGATGGGTGAGGAVAGGGAAAGGGVAGGGAAGGVAPGGATSGGGAAGGGTGAGGAVAGGGAAAGGGGVAGGGAAGSATAVADLTVAVVAYDPAAATAVSWPANGQAQYFVDVRNNGSGAADGAMLRVPASAGLSGWYSITCVESGGARCPPGGVAIGQLESGQTIPGLPAGGAMRFGFYTNVTGAPGGSVGVIAMVNPPAGVSDPSPGNNSALQTQAIVAAAAATSSSNTGTLPVPPTGGRGRGSINIPIAPGSPTPSSAPTPSNSTSTASSSPGSGVYLVSFAGIIAGQPTRDTVISGLLNVGDPDGKGDEVFAAAYVRRFDRTTSQLLESGTRQTLPYGDITGNTASRFQGGTQTPTGGVQANDWIPANLSVARINAAQDSAFPLRAWEGRLTDGADVLLVSPTVWEYDGGSSVFQQWAQSQTLLSSTILTDPNVQARIGARGFGAFEVGVTSPTFPGLPQLIIDGRQDRPIGLRQMGSGTVVPNITLVLTREIIEQALSSQWTTVQLSVVPGQTINVPKPGILVLNFVDQPPSGVPGGSYSLILQVEKVGN